MTEPTKQNTEAEGEKRYGLHPATRRTILRLLALVALVAILAEVVLLVYGVTTSEALLTIAATAVGALGGMARPDGD